MTNPQHSIGLLTPLEHGALDDRSALRTIRHWLEGVDRRKLLIVLDLAAVLVIVADVRPARPPGAPLPRRLRHPDRGGLHLRSAHLPPAGRSSSRSPSSPMRVCRALGIQAEPLELTEWPLMFTIAVLVAWMADREQSVGRRYAGLYRETRDRLVRAQEEERGHIARDLHDGIGQTLTALTLTLDAAATGDARERLAPSNGAASSRARHWPTRASQPSASARHDWPSAGWPVRCGR